MKRCVLMAIVLVLSFTSKAQDKENLKPDYTAIEKTIADPNSIFYYPPLFLRYKNNDTTLTRREYRYLYYGYFFNKAYRFSQNHPAEDSLDLILKKNILSVKDWRLVIRLLNKCLERNPFELKKLNLMYFAYKNLGDDLHQHIYKDKIQKIAYTILSSGDGESEETALHVLQVSDEYSLINMLGYKFNGKREMRGDRCDYLTLEANDDDIQGLYFDLKQVFAEYEGELGYKKPK